MIKVGCCGFAVARDRYFKKFDLVEVDQTFYQMPPARTAQRWRQEAGKNFEFTVTAWQLITHPPASPSYEKLKVPLSPRKIKNYGSFQLTSEVLSAWELTTEVARALEARIIVFRCPPSFIPEKTHIDNLTKFFGSVERYDFRMVWQPGTAWPEDLVESLCRDLGLIHCTDLLSHRPLTGSPWYLRLQGKGHARAPYTDKDLTDLVRVLSPIPEAYVLFGTPTMLDDASRLKKMMKA